MTEFAHAGIRLKTARMAAGFKSAKEFCDKHEIPSSTYSLHETGGRNLKPKIAEKYSELLGINPAWLLTGTGSPYKTEAEDEPLTHDEFMELLKYQGNDKVKRSLPYKNEYLNNVNTFVFCKIVVGMVETLQKLNFHLEINQITKKAVETYKDISLSSNDQEAQLTMVDLSITTFNRQIHELINDNKKVVNKSRVS